MSIQVGTTLLCFCVKISTVLGIKVVCVLQYHIIDLKLKVITYKYPILVAKHPMNKESHSIKTRPAKWVSYQHTLCICFLSLATNIFNRVSSQLHVLISVLKKLLFSNNLFYVFKGSKVEFFLEEWARNIRKTIKHVGEWKCFTEIHGVLLISLFQLKRKTVLWK